MRRFKEDGDQLKLQLEEMNNYIDDKESRIMELEEIKRNYEEQLIIKDMELKNIPDRIKKQTIKIMNPIAATQIKIDEERK